MKKQVLNLVAILSLLATLTAASVYARSAGSLKVNIPFSFMAGKATLPAGTYTVERSGAQGVLVIRNIDGGASAAVLTQATESRAAQAQSKLDFHRYGEQYFLSKVWTEGDTVGRELPKTRMEREAAKGASKHLAQNLEPEVVSITAQ